MLAIIQVNQGVKVPENHISAVKSRFFEVSGTQVSTLMDSPIRGMGGNKNLRHNDQSHDQGDTVVSD